jgi:hypothetical protein
VLAAAILDQKKIPPSTAVKTFLQFLEAATTLERQDWALERQVLLVLDSARGACKRQCLHCGWRSSVRYGRSSVTPFFSTLISSKISSSLMSLICLEFSLRPENKENTKTHQKY